MAEQDMDDLLANIGKSIKEALDAVETHGVDSFMSKFEMKPGEGGGPSKLMPKTVTVPMPTPDGQYENREVPIVGLLHHSALQLDELKLKMKVSLSSPGENETLRAEVGPAVAEAEGSPNLAAARMRPEMAEIEVTFKRAIAPEGLARIYTEFQKKIA